MPGENLIDLCRQKHMPIVDAAQIAGIVLMCINGTYYNTWASLVAQVVKNLPAKAGNAGESGLIPGSGGSPGEGHSNPLQYSYLENFMNKATW